jgi:ribosomal protein S12 methylthiotransferase
MSQAHRNARTRTHRRRSQRSVLPRIASLLAGLLVAGGLVTERLLELSELQDRITAERRAALIGRQVEVLVDEPGVGRTHREAPEIDGILAVPDDWHVGSFMAATVTAAAGPDLEAA